MSSYNWKSTGGAGSWSPPVNSGGREDGEEEGVRGSRKGKGMQKDIEGEGEEGHEGAVGGKGRGGDGEQLC